MTNTLSFDEQYKNLINDIIANGTKKSDRTGVGTLSVFGRMLTIDLQKGFPLLTLKDTHFKSVLHELLWMLDSVDENYKYTPEDGGGCSNIKYLEDNDVRIWREWPYEKYLKACDHSVVSEQYLNDEGEPFDKKQFANAIKTDPTFATSYGSIGPVYGIMWRYWPATDHNGTRRYIDQVKNVISTLKNNPDSRRIMVTAWNPEFLDAQALPPCHYAYQFWTRELTHSERYDIYIKRHMQKYNFHGGYPMVGFTEEHFDNCGIPKRGVSMMFQMRSVDVILGLPFDVASYALQLMIIAQQCDMVPLELSVCTGDTHIYLNHLDGIGNFIDREPKHLPDVVLNAKDDIGDYRYEDFTLVGYDPHPKVPFKVAV